MPASRCVVPLSRYRSFAIAVLFVLRCGLLACRCRGRCRCSLISSSHHIVGRCRPAFPACFVASRLCRLISSVIVSPVSSPFFDTVGLGVRRGASGVLLAWFFPAVCADVDRSVHAVSSCDVPSVCLPVVSVRLRGRWRLISSVRSMLRCPACPSSRLVSRLVYHHVGRVGSSPLAPSCDTMGGEEGGCGGAIRLSLRLSRSPCLLALGRSSPSI